VAKAELGIKRLCPNCGAKYYDLNKDPIICPRCGTQYEVSNTRTRAQARPVDEEKESETETDEPADFVTLEEADEEAAESGAVKIDGDDDDDDDVVDAGDEDDTFLAEEEDEEGDDVTDIIGDVDEEES